MMWTVRAVAASRAWNAARIGSTLRTAAMSTSAMRWDVHKMTMPAMSPTMERGNLGQWKVKEGDTFNAGDVLLEVETDKAMMDVEADDDGKMAKILVPSGSKDVEVNKLIAYLASPDDDLSSLELPDAEESSKPSAQENKPAQEDKPVQEERSEAPRQQKKAPESPAHVSFEHTPLPSVLRLAEKYGIEHPEKEIKGTGLHGILTKGDVLAYVGKVKSPFGSASGKATKITDLGMPASKDAASSPAKKPSITSLTPDEERDLILAGLVQLSSPKPAPAPVATFDTIMDAYKAPVTKQGPAPPPEARRTTAKSALEHFYANLLG